VVVVILAEKATAAVAVVSEAVILEASRRINF
jgi:hypothetical protein